jgi:DNA-binding HxlR family transcriptional regulator
LLAAKAGARQLAADYNQFCPVARTLDVIGDRWSMLVLRDLFLHGPRKFHELQSSLTGISPNTLSARLKTLEEHAIVSRRLYEEHPPRAEYVLTEKGSELRPVLRSLRVWGEKHIKGVRKGA